MDFTRRLGAWERTLTEGNKGRSVPLEPRLETGDNEEKRRPENTPP